MNKRLKSTATQVLLFAIIALGIPQTAQAESGDMPTFVQSTVARDIETGFSKLSDGEKATIICALQALLCDISDRVRENTFNLEYYCPLARHIAGMIFFGQPEKIERTSQELLNVINHIAFSLTTFKDFTGDPSFFINDQKTQCITWQEFLENPTVKLGVTHHLNQDDVKTNAADILTDLVSSKDTKLALSADYIVGCLVSSLPPEGISNSLESLLLCAAFDNFHEDIRHAVIVHLANNQRLSQTNLEDLKKLLHDKKTPTVVQSAIVECMPELHSHEQIQALAKSGTISLGLAKIWLDINLLPKQRTSNEITYLHEASNISTLANFYSKGITDESKKQLARACFHASVEKFIFAFMPAMPPASKMWQMQYLIGQGAEKYMVSNNYQLDQLFGMHVLTKVFVHVLELAKSPRAQETSLLSCLFL